jgi:hypothetical protein
MNEKELNYYEYQCPNCGRWADDDSLVSKTEEQYNYGKACEFGGTPVDWVEYHKCLTCDTEFSFDNSNC